MNAWTPPDGLDPTRLELQHDEVDAVAWATCAEILAMIADGRSVTIKPSLVELLFALHERPGLQTRSFSDWDDE